MSPQVHEPSTTATVSTVVQSLLDEGSRHVGPGPSLAVTISREAARLAQEVGDELGLAKAYLLCADGLRRTGDLVSAQTMLDDAEALFLRFGAHQDLPSLWQGRAVIYSNAGKLEEADALLTKALPLAREMQDVPTIQRILTTWAVLRLRQSDYADATKYLEEALTSLHDHPSGGVEIVVYNAMGSLYQRTRNFELALEYFQKGLELSREFALKNGSQSRARCSSLICMAEILHGLGRYKEIPELLDECLDVAEAHDLVDVQASVQRAYGQLEFAVGNYTKAIPYLDAARELLEVTGNGMILLTVLTLLADCYSQSDEHHKAIGVLVEGLQMLESVGSPQHEYDFEHRLARAYRAIGDLANAAEHFEASINAHERLFSEANQNVLREIEKRTAVESARREKAILEAHAEQLSKSHGALKLLHERQVEILRVVSHDMRNPLAAIVGLGGEIARNEELPIEEVQRLGQTIEESAHKLLQLTDQLLLASQLQTDEAAIAERIQVEDVANQAIRLIRPLADVKGIKLSYESGVLEAVTVNVERLSHILNNLLSNAVKFTPHGGRVQVSATARGGKVVLSVTDSGIGIPAELQPSLFSDAHDNRPGTENERGTGFGLMLVKKLVELEHGSIEVKSVEGAGTTVVISIPTPTLLM